MTTAIETTCPSCHRPVGANARFCGGCGARLPQTPGGVARIAQRARTPAARAHSPRDAVAVAAKKDVAPGDVERTGAAWSWWSVLSVAANPGRVVSDAVRSMPWPVALGVSGTAFALLFLQTGLDLERVGRATGSGLRMALTGALLGTAGLAAIAAAAWLLSRAVGGRQGIGAAIKSFGLCYSPALVSGVSGVACNLLLGWNTTLAFGVTGFLWALGPQVVAFRELSGGRLGMAVLMATVCGGVLLFLWYAVVAG